MSHPLDLFSKSKSRMEPSYFHVLKPAKDFDNEAELRKLYGLLDEKLPVTAPNDIVQFKQVLQDISNVSNTDLINADSVYSTFFERKQVK